MKIRELKQRHLEAWTAALRAERPADIDKLSDLPLVEYYGVAVRAAVKADWYVGDDAPENPAEFVGDLTYQETRRLGREAWQAFDEATKIDPNLNGQRETSPTDALPEHQ